MKIKCPFCNFENGEGSKFCSNCGKPIFTIKEDKESSKNSLTPDLKNKKVKRSYRKIGLILFLIILAYFLGPRLGLFLTPSYTTLRVTNAPDTRIDTDDPDYPLEFISDGYKFTGITKENVNWVWQYTLLNKSDKNIDVTITYKLKDKDNFIIDSSTKSGKVNKHSEITIKGVDSIPVYELKGYMAVLGI